MITQLMPSMKAVHEYWACTLTDMVWSQWVMWDTGLRVTQTVLSSAAPEDEKVPSGEPVSSVPRETGSLIKRARERMRAGLPPPAEIYQTPYRNQIDWQQFPEWSRPSDPDAFEGSSHEG
jgi:hypothetical protein